MGMQSLILSTALFLYVFKLFFIFVNFPMNLNQYLDQYYSETRTYIYSLIVISWSQENSLTSTTLRNTRNKGLQISNLKLLIQFSTSQSQRLYIIHAVLSGSLSGRLPVCDSNHHQKRKVTKWIPDSISVWISHPGYSFSKENVNSVYHQLNSAQKR